MQIHLLTRNRLAGLSASIAAASLLTGCMSEPSPTPDDTSSAMSSSLAIASSSSSLVASSSVASSQPLPSSSSIAPSSSSVASSSQARELPLVVAINSGGPDMAVDGVDFIADKYVSGGMTNTTRDNVEGGALYQSERYGEFKYEIPVTANGRYTVTLHFAEVYQTNPGTRSFDVAIEGNVVVDDLDLFEKVGHDVGYSQTFSDIQVNDGSVSIQLIANVQNPTMAGLAVYSEDGQLDTSVSVLPDFSKYSAYTQRYEQRTTMTQNHATGHIGDYFFTHWKDGGSTSLTMDTDGSFSVSWQGGGYNYVGGPGWHYGDENRVIGYRFDQDGGPSYITLYGWGYDKDMPRNNPAHLVEYYILQRWTYDPSQGATPGKTFTSNGVRYTTFRSTRTNQPSINSPSTFYQYWSKPDQPLPLGQDHKIIFADHVRAWADNGWIIPNMNNLDASDDPTYQVMAVEVFNPRNSGTASGRVWDATGE